jgi:hypothetical protein
MKTSLQYPTHAYPDARTFKAEKRRHLREVKRAVDQLRLGCAYFPGGSHRVDAISDQIEELQRELSAKEWGR